MWVKMSTGQASVELWASSPSAAAESSTSTAMKIPSLPLRAPLGSGSAPTPPRSEILAPTIGDVLDSLGHLDAGRRQAGDLLAGRVGLAFDDRAGVAEAHPGHLVHEPARHEGDDRQPRGVLGDPLGQLGLHAATRLGVDDDPLGLLSASNRGISSA